MMTPEQIGLYQAVLDRLVADVTEVGGGEPEAGCDPRCHHGAQADLQPPGRLPVRRPPARRSVRQARPPRGDRRRGVRGRREGPDLHPLRRVGQEAGRPPHRAHRRAHRLLPRRSRPGRPRQDGRRVPGAPRRRCTRPVAQGRWHRPQPHRRQPRRALRPLVEPRRRGPSARPGVAHRPDPHRRVAPPRVPRHGRRTRRGGRRRQAPHRRPRAPELQLARRPRHEPAAGGPRPPRRQLLTEDES